MKQCRVAAARLALTASSSKTGPSTLAAINPNAEPAVEQPAAGAAKGIMAAAATPAIPPQYPPYLGRDHPSNNSPYLPRAMATSIRPHPPARPSRVPDVRSRPDGCAAPRATRVSAIQETGSGSASVNESETGSGRGKGSTAREREREFPPHSHPSLAL
ncbi:hypothetical protein C8R45DRAFT_1085035 [Mycena sanguinolenta]|nr:hypothetical protein C8R45DRAFT_1085035 [Mycena sanguinolenta]